MELDRFVHFGKLDRVGLSFLGRDPDGFFVGKVAGGVEGVNAHVHQGTASRQGFFESPLGRVTDFEALVVVDVVQLAHLARLDHLDDFTCVRLEV